MFTLGRFVQPDTIIPNLGSPIDFDRYGYVRNNPTRYTDPSGHFTEEEICTYWGYCTEEEAREGLGNLFDLLWNTDVTWGDILVYKDGNGELRKAMFILQEFAYMEFRAILWDIDGGVKVAWESVNNLSKFAIYHEGDKGKRDIFLGGELSLDEFKNWFGGAIPDLNYTIKDLFVKYQGPYGGRAGFYTYTNVGFVWIVDAAGALVSFFVPGGLIVSGVLAGLDIGGIISDGLLGGLMQGPIDSTFPVFCGNPLFDFSIAVHANDPNSAFGGMDLERPSWR